MVERKTRKNILKSVIKAVRLRDTKIYKKKILITETERSAVIYGLKEDDVKNYDNRIESDMTKLSNLVNNGIKIQMSDIIKVHRVGKYNTNRKVPRPLKLN